MFIHTDIFLPPGKNITLRFLLPESNKVICCQGKVAWINHPEWIKSAELPVGMGICFTSVSEPDMIAFQMFLQMKNVRAGNDF